MIKNFCALTLALAVAFCPNLNRAQATNDRFQKQLQPIIEQAIKNYEKSLELDPANGNAVEMLKKLKGQ